MRSLLSYSSSPGLPWTLQAETTCTACGGTEFVEVADSELVEVLYSDGGDEQLHGNANEDGCESQDVNRTLSSFPDGNSPIRGRVWGNFSPCGDGYGKKLSPSDLQVQVWDSIPHPRLSVGTR
jgi:hypothetical protein